VGEKHHSIVANPKPKFVARWTKLFHIADSGCQILVESVQNAKRGFSVNCGNLSL
jgi:hypothetical protein